jgi:hypothetical protein
METINNIMNILVNNEIVNFNKEDFPMLVNGKAFVQSGASFFSVSLMTKLFEQGEKIVFFTGFDPAKELFKDQLGGRMNDNIIIIPTGDEDAFIKKLDEIKDIDERIILFKNIEEYSIKLFDKLKEKKLVIFSGDIDGCVFGEQLIEKEFKTKIFFSYPDKIKLEDQVVLPKYNGLIIGDRNNGIIRLE